MPRIAPIDFTTGAWSSGRTARADIIIAGDWAPIRAFAPLIEQDPLSIYGDLLAPIQAADLAVVNLEAPLSDLGDPMCKSGAVFKGDACHVKGLAAVPFHAVTLANNHMFDFGVRAFQETVSNLEQHGIRHTGAGTDLETATKPLIMSARGVRLAIVNFSEGEDLTAAGPGPGVAGWDIQAVASQIKSLKQEVDAVIAIAHCGLEYIPFAPAYVTRAFRELADAGADAVIGHHPHVPQGLFLHGTTPVCCSLGNFVFYQPTRLLWRKLGYMVRIRLADEGLAGLDIIPYRIHGRGLAALSGQDRSRFFTRIQEISAPLATEQGCVDAWNGFLDYYGTSGFKNEVNTILDTLDTAPEKGAAMFRNRLTTAQHYHHWKDLLSRIVSGETGTAPDWAKDLAREWLTLELK